MGDMNMLRPPPHLEGVLLQLESTSFFLGVRKWEEKFLKVLRSVLIISKSKDECEKGNYLEKIDLLHVDIYEAFIQKSSKLYIFKIIDGTLERCFSCNSAEECTRWTTRLAQVKKHWIYRNQQSKLTNGNEVHSNSLNTITTTKTTQRMNTTNTTNTTHTINTTKISRIIEPKECVVDQYGGIEVPEMSDDMFLFTLGMHDHTRKVMTLKKTATFNEMFHVITQQTNCPDCKTCLIRKRSARLYGVNSHGQIFHINKEDCLYPYYKACCQFYMAEKSLTRLIVIHFSNDTFLPCLVEQNITTRELRSHRVYAERSKQIEPSRNLALLYQLNDKISLCTPDDTPLSLLYDEHGKPLNNNAKLIFQVVDDNVRNTQPDQNKEIRRKTIMENAIKERLKREEEDAMKSKVKHVWEEKKVDVAMSLGNAVPDIMDAYDAIKTERGQMRFHPVKLSSGQIIMEPYNSNDEDEEEKTTLGGKEDEPCTFVIDHDSKNNNKSTESTDDKKQLRNMNSIDEVYSRQRVQPINTSDSRRVRKRLGKASVPPEQSNPQGESKTIDSIKSDENKHEVEVQINYRTEQSIPKPNEDIASLKINQMCTEEEGHFSDMELYNKEIEAEILSDDTKSKLNDQVYSSIGTNNNTQIRSDNVTEENVDLTNDLKYLKKSTLNTEKENYSINSNESGDTIGSGNFQERTLPDVNIDHKNSTADGSSGVNGNKIIQVIPDADEVKHTVDKSSFPVLEVIYPVSDDVTNISNNEANNGSLEDARLETNLSIHNNSANNSIVELNDNTSYEVCDSYVHETDHDSNISQIIDGDMITANMSNADTTIKDSNDNYSNTNKDLITSETNAVCNNEDETNTVLDQHQDTEENKSTVKATDDNPVAVDKTVSSGGELDSYPMIKPPCDLCANITYEKPLSVRTKELMKWIMNQSTRGDQHKYICLLGTHFRYQNGGWELADNCDITKDTEECYDDVKKKLSRFILGNGFICIWIPKRNNKPPRWLIKRVEEIHRNCLPDVNVDELTAHPSVPPCDEDSSPEHSSCEDSFQLPSRPPSATSSIITNVINTVKDAKHNIGTKQMRETAENAKKHIFNSAKVAKDTFDTISHKSFSMQHETTPFENGILPAELLLFQSIYTKPLQIVILNICSTFENISIEEQRNRGDDVETPAIGWLVRNDFCTVIAKLLDIGLSGGRSVLKSLFGKQEEITLWKIVKDFSLSYKCDDFVAVVDCIERSKWLLSDDMKFRFFLCELLNRSAMDGSEKLIVTWFKHFPLESNKIMKYYVIGSFWRMKYNDHFALLFEEIIICLMQLNGVPFCLHDFFEMQFVHLRENSLRVRKRKEKSSESDDIVCMF